MLAIFTGLLVRTCRVSFVVTVVRSVRLSCGVLLVLCDPDSLLRGAGALLAESEGRTSASSSRDDGNRGLEIDGVVFPALWVAPRFPSGFLDISEATMALHALKPAHPLIGRDAGTDCLLWCAKSCGVGCSEGTLAGIIAILSSSSGCFWRRLALNTANQFRA